MTSEQSNSMIEKYDWQATSEISDVGNLSMEWGLETEAEVAAIIQKHMKRLTNDQTTTIG